MRMNVDKNTLCPFYSREDECRIQCEGVCERTSLYLVFSDVSKKRAYKKVNCNCNYMNCMIAQMLYRKYDT